MARKKDMRMCHPPHWSEPRLVRVMAIAEGYGLVRRPGCAPFAVSEKHLYKMEGQADG